LFDVPRALIFYVGMLKCRCYLSSLSSKPVYFQVFYLVLVILVADVAYGVGKTEIF